MWNWFRPTCPVAPLEKEWIESQLCWLAGQFGWELFTVRPVILPSPEFFPDPYDATESAVARMLRRVCDYMQADPLRVELECYTDDQQLWLVNDRGHPVPRPAGLYVADEQRTIVQLESSQFHRPEDLVGTMAHELAHMRLMGEQRIDPERYDNELLTDLTAVFHGFGIFLANSPRAWLCDMSHWPGTVFPRPEYMTLQMLTYALAHAAWHRRERRPEWLRHLRPDARVCFRQSLHYLWETDDSRFRR